ncbi:Sphingosine kinase 2 [Bulinus truncatus]|nr:Sphingosine kinase 2 [Bulinus truncatus]
MTIAWSHDLLGCKMASSVDEVILEGDFLLFPKKRGFFKLTLTRRGLYYTAVSNNNTLYEEKCIHISDIIGCHCLVKGGNVTLPGAVLPSPSEKQNNTQLDWEREPENVTFPNNYFPRTSDSETCGFVIYAYPFKKKLLSSKKSRCRLVIAFEIDQSCKEFIEEKKKEVLKWHTVINLLARDSHFNINDVSTCVLPSRGKLLILINPHSGPGKAYTIFKSEIVPMLYEANIPYTAIITDHAGHASELMKEIKLSDWYGVVIVSGDGLIFETINGIMQRDDWATSISVPVGCLPGGSGNALCCSINYSAGEPLDPMVIHSTFILVKHRVVPMDLVIVQIPNRSIFSFLSVTWGIMADIDYESEKYRNLGEARFTLGAIRRIVGLRSYRGRISFLPVAEYSAKETGNQKKVLTKIHRFSLRSRSNSKNTLDSASKESNSPRLVAKRSYSMNESGYSEHQLRLAEGDQSNIANGTEAMDELADAVLIIEDGGGVILDIPNSVNKPMSGEGMERGDSENEKSIVSEKVSSYQPTRTLRADSGSCNMTILSEAQEFKVEEETYSGKKSDFSPVPTPLLSALDQKVPDSWVKLEGDFILITAIYQTHLGSDMLAAPDAHLCDGHINLMMVREGISRNALLNLFLSFGQGGHVHSPYVESVKVLAFRLEPETKSGNIMIDGERFDPCPLQAQILPGLARVMAIK